MLSEKYPVSHSNRVGPKSSRLVLRLPYQTRPEVIKPAKNTEAMLLERLASILARLRSE